VHPFDGYLNHAFLSLPGLFSHLTPYIFTILDPCTQSALGRPCQWSPWTLHMPTICSPSCVMEFIYLDQVSNSNFFEISGDIALSKDLKSPQYPTQHNLLGFLHSICHYINSTNFADPTMNLFFVLILTCITVSITIEAHGPFRCHPPNHYCSKTGQQFTCCSAKRLSFCPIPWLPSWFFHKVLSIAWAIL
jgi:hypothetical protein